MCSDLIISSHIQHLIKLTRRAVGMVTDPDVVDTVDAPLDLGVHASHCCRVSVRIPFEPRLFRNELRVWAADHLTVKNEHARTLLNIK